MAATREPRCNAGSRMAQLLDGQEEDEFYQNTYGGFNEEVGDDEYKSEEEESDEVDTDFSIEEDDELASDGQDDEEPRKRKKIFVSKALQKRKKPLEEKDSKKPNASRESEEQQAKRHVAKRNLAFERKSIRKSTKEKSEATQRRHREREEMLRCREKKIVTEYQRLTQEELLVEAKITEQKNLKSLESYQRLELERKKARVVKQSYSGPIIRYHSVSMPIIKSIMPLESEKIDVVDDTKEVAIKPSDVSNDERCSRNFVTFTDERLFRSYFRNVRPHVPQRNMCPITRMPARYYDPVTQMAYANLQAFKVLREAYYQQLEQKGDRKQPDVATWIDWRKKMKAEQQTQLMTRQPKPHL